MIENESDDQDGDNSSILTDRWYLRIAIIPIFLLWGDGVGAGDEFLFFFRSLISIRGMQKLTYSVF